MVGASSGAESGGRGLDFDGIAERGAGAVGFEVVDVGGLETGLAQSVTDDALLGASARHRQAARGAVLVHGASANDGADAVAVALGRRSTA